MSRGWLRNRLSLLVGKEHAHHDHESICYLVSGRMRVVIDWVKGLFDQRTWPWFREDFVQPVVGRKG